MGNSRVRACRILVFFILTVNLWSAGAAAQGTTGSSFRPWEISFSGGVMSGHGLASGTGQLPPPGEVYVSPLPGFPPTRLIPSWWFGDGALLFNEVRNALPQIQPTPSIVPLDETLRRGVLRRSAGLVLGAGVARAINARLTAEFRLDVTTGSLSFDDDVRPAAETTRRSLESAFPAMIPNTLTITTDVTAEEASGGEMMAVGALRISLAPGRAIEPYAVVGGGVAKALGGDGPSLHLRDDVRIVLSGTAQLEQSDVVTVTTHPQLGAVFVAGGGLRRTIGGRSAIRVDARVHWIGDTTTTRVQAAPADTPGSGSFVFGRASTLSLLFSTRPDLVRSSLSAPIAGFDTFTANGMRTQFSVTFGYDIRF